MTITGVQLDHWRRRQTDQQAQNRRLAERARADLARIVDVLVQEFSARQVIVFGSLVRGHFGPNSDVDLAVEGVPPADFFVALARANRLTSSWVDLKPLEDLEPRFRERVLATGEVLYAADVRH
jgi:predicted nucleotidyltransferase